MLQIHPKYRLKCEGSENNSPLSRNLDHFKNFDPDSDFVKFVSKLKLHLIKCEEFGNNSYLAQNI